VPSSPQIPPRFPPLFTVQCDSSDVLLRAVYATPPLVSSHSSKQIPKPTASLPVALPPQFLRSSPKHDLRFTNFESPETLLHSPYITSLILSFPPPPHPSPSSNQHYPPARCHLDLITRALPQTLQSARPTNPSSSFPFLHKRKLTDPLFPRKPGLRPRKPMSPEPRFPQHVGLSLSPHFVPCRPFATTIIPMRGSPRPYRNGPPYSPTTLLSPFFWLPHALTPPYFLSFLSSPTRGGLLFSSRTLDPYSPLFCHPSLPPSGSMVIVPRPFFSWPVLKTQVPFVLPQ